ncbi:MAG TPA: DUF2459 domain-containing protein [Stellaceae bacterium]|nr:DUF2459 domain-containing protein [Stellaceae bacterium]
MLGLIMAGVAGCSTTAGLAPGRAELERGGGTYVSIVDRGWHTDIVLPAAPQSGPLVRVADAFPGAHFLVFGFGDREYYMSRQESVMQTMRAMFPGPGVILVTALKQPPADAFGAERVVTLRISCDEFSNIRAFVAHSLATRTDDRPQPLAEGPYPGSEFYASEEIYDLFHNCNRWTAEGLHEAGLPVNPESVIFAGQVMGQVEALAKAEPQQLASALAGGCAPRGRVGGF